MSVKEFSEALQSKAFKDWFQRLSTDNILKVAAKDLRKKEAGAEFNSFYITENTIAEVIEALTQAKASPEDVTKVLQNFREATYGGKYGNKKGLKITEPYIQGTGLYFPRISFDAIGTLLDKGFKEVLEKARAKNPDIKISDFFQRGHVFGIFPKKVAETRRSLERNTTLDPKARQIMVSVLSDLEKSLLEEDLATSNLKSQEVGLYAKYVKKPKNYLVELQLKDVNEQAGREQAPLSRAVRKFFNPGAVTKNLTFSDGVSEQKLKSIIETSVEKLFSTKGSPSMEDLIVENLVLSIQGKKLNNKTYTLNETLISKTRSAKVDTRVVNKKIKEELSAVRKLKKSVQRVPAFSQPTKTLEVSLISLQNLINGSLRERIVANMGKGSDTRVLNYHTGRFADSVKLERMSQSREGMITAFYSYMKNPYATFSAGGRQENPKSRDPKLLISKSIREIAAREVGNRLRAVNV